MAKKKGYTKTHTARGDSITESENKEISNKKLQNHGNENQTPQNERSRRDLLTVVGNSLIALCGLSLAGASVRLALPNVQSGPPTRFSIGPAALFKMGTLNWLREHNLFVLHDQVGFGVFSARCTHLGCIVQRTSTGFVCPCHGARFGAHGELLAGPARRPLPWFQLGYEPLDGRLWVDCEVTATAITQPLHRLRKGMDR